MKPYRIACIIFCSLMVAMFVVCGGVMRGCSNDFDRATGNPKSFEWWAW